MPQSDFDGQMSQAGIVALSLGERVARVRRFHPPARVG